MMQAPKAPAPITEEDSVSCSSEDLRGFLFSSVSSSGPGQRYPTRTRPPRGQSVLGVFMRQQKHQAPPSPTDYQSEQLEELPAGKSELILQDHATTSEASDFDVSDLSAKSLSAKHRQAVDSLEAAEDLIRNAELTELQLLDSDFKRRSIRELQDFQSRVPPLPMTLSPSPPRVHRRIQADESPAQASDDISSKRERAKSEVRRKASERKLRNSWEVRRSNDSDASGGSSPDDIDLEDDEVLSSSLESSSSTKMLLERVRDKELRLLEKKKRLDDEVNELRRKERLMRERDAKIKKLQTLFDKLDSEENYYEVKIADALDKSKRVDAQIAGQAVVLQRLIDRRDVSLALANPEVVDRLIDHALQPAASETSAEYESDFEEDVTSPKAPVTPTPSPSPPPSSENSPLADDHPTSPRSWLNGLPITDQDSYLARLSEDILLGALAVAAPVPRAPAKPREIVDTVLEEFRLAGATSVEQLVSHPPQLAHRKLSAALGVPLAVVQLVCDTVVEEATDASSEKLHERWRARSGWGTMNPRVALQPIQQSWDDLAGRVHRLLNENHCTRATPDPAKTVEQYQEEYVDSQGYLDAVMQREVVRVKDGVYVGGEEYGAIQEGLIEELSSAILESLVSDLVNS